jgi:hypothetical protein
LVFALPPAEPVNEIGSDIFKYIPPSLAEARKSEGELRPDNFNRALFSTRDF